MLRARMFGNLARILFVLLAGTLAALGHLYVYRRLVRDVIASAPVRALARWLMIVLGASAFLIRPVARLFVGTAPAWVLTPFLVWLGVVLYLLLVTLALDGGRALFLRWRERQGRPVAPERRAFLARSLAAGSALAGGGLGAFGTWSAFHPPEISEVPVALPGLPKALDGFTIVQLTDIHVGAVIQRRFLDELVARANAVKPDLIALTGDLVDGTPEQLGSAVAAIQNLRAPHGVFFVTGNHDYYSGVGPWIDVVTSLGLQPLRNRLVRIGDAGASFDLLGVDDWSSRDGGDRWTGPADSRYDLEAAVRGRDPDRPSVLLAHQPTNMPEVSRHRIGLQLSGHTHGGQMFPGTGVARLIWSERTAGLSRQGNTWLYVSRGCGFVGPPMRVGSPPELVKIVLVAS
ncbi:MAG TPA: metallophosphoesterase [Myxococcales bacterium]|nr:metallophosphoesterase [Myxococcales bacterium]